MMDALAAAVEEGWSSPLPLLPAAEDEHEGTGGTVLDYRVLGYPGGGMVLVVLDGEDIRYEQAALATAALGGHCTSWSPGLMEYTVTEVLITPLDEPHDAENWLPPFADEEEPTVRWPLEHLIGDDLQSLAARYLLLAGVRSLWNVPRRSDRPRIDADDVAIGAADHAWSPELAGELGTLLIQAARLERELSSEPGPVVLGEADAELTADLLQLVRATAVQHETEGWTEDHMRGHALLERFMEDHALLWNRVLDDDPEGRHDQLSARRLRNLLRAGMSALATLLSPLSGTNNPWQLLDELDDNDVVAALAERETSRVERGEANDAHEIRAAAFAHAAVWLAVRQPELLTAEEGWGLLDALAEDVTGFYQVAHTALLLSGAGPVGVALEELADELSEEILRPMADFVGALRITEAVAPEEFESDPYNDMYAALERALEEGDDLTQELRDLLSVIGRAASLTATEANPRRGLDGHVSAPSELTSDLLAHASEHAALVVAEEDDDVAVRRLMLAFVARLDPRAAGAVAAQLPDLTGDDPRTEPAARERAYRWVVDALVIAEERGTDVRRIETSADGHTVLDAIVSGGRPPAEWPVEQLTAAAAEAATAVLHAAHAVDRAESVFAAG
ncbi:hypothetical protein [Actinomadura hibisca]|uniref:hypothetical protein n=1 Tax=Actinomadura hibisca TaxID=68565 RepID=UPI00082AAE1D|nr:hypothetical protein [Actinomadura hibisca]